LCKEVYGKTLQQNEEA